MDIENWNSLALGYVQGKLTIEEKLTVFRLLSSNDEFRIILKEELALSRRLNTLKVSLSEETKHSILQKIQYTITEDMEQTKGPTGYFVDLILSMTMPNLALDMINLLKRGCV